jgi:RNA-directed DNA polymerase
MRNLKKVICDGTGIDAEDLERLIKTAPSRYKVFRIRKNTGGWRQIAHPARELKLVQRKLLASFVQSLPVHNSSTAYQKNTSVRDNAEPHAGHSPILKMDFKNFFPSIKSYDWVNYCTSNELLTPDDIEMTSQLFFWRHPKAKVDSLSIGAPTSPSLSNAMLMDFDKKIFEESEKRAIAYTRFADDLTFSGQRMGMLKDMEKIVKSTCLTLESPKLRVNHKKTVYVSTAHRRKVTGLILSNDGNIGLGRDKRREISKKVFHVQKVSVVR